MDSPLKLLIAMIVAIAIIYLALSYFSQVQTDNSAEMKKALDYAQANEGKLHKVTLTFMS